MIRIGDKVLVVAKVSQIVETKDGVHYVVIPDDKNRYYDSMKVVSQDIHACLDK